MPLPCVCREHHFVLNQLRRRARAPSAALPWKDLNRVAPDVGFCSCEVPWEREVCCVGGEGVLCSITEAPVHPGGYLGIQGGRIRLVPWSMGCDGGAGGGAQDLTLLLVLQQCGLPWSTSTSLGCPKPPFGCISGLGELLEQFKKGSCSLGLKPGLPQKVKTISGGYVCGSHPREHLLLPGAAELLLCLSPTPRWGRT